MSSIEDLPVVEHQNIGEISRLRTRESIRLRERLRAKPDIHPNLMFTSTDAPITLPTFSDYAEPERVSSLSKVPRKSFDAAALAAAIEAPS
jgi:hypothetical protein